MYGPDEGWCAAEDRGRVSAKANRVCGCAIDSLTGPLCEAPKEAFCVAQCSGRGACDLGFCRCREGWYGSDCSRKVAGAEEEEPLDVSPWLQPVLKRLPRASDGLNAAAGEQTHKAAMEHRRRIRPYIFVYDLPPMFNSHMLQYRLSVGDCSYRHFQGDVNVSLIEGGGVYGTETFIHEAMLLSSHRWVSPLLP